jgi:fatty-acyl-CoA synthase
VLIERAQTDPERLAYDDGSRRMTYGELLESAEQRAARLAAAGVGARDRVVLAMSSGIPFAEAFWALQLLGASTCALSPAAPAPTVAGRAAYFRPRLVLHDDWLDRAPTESGTPEAPGLSTEDIAFIQPTSGTSGEPRGAMILHRNVLGYLRSTDGDRHVDRDDVMVAWVPPWHDLGLVRFVIGSVFYGAACHIVEPAIRTIPQWLETIARTGGTVTGAPDFCYRLATRMVAPGSVDLSSLRFSTNGGEPVRSSTIEAFERSFGIRRVVLPGYGLAEATLGVTTAMPGDPLVVDARGNVSCGKAMTGLELRADGELSEPGEILVRGDVVFAGYFDAPEESRERVRDGWLRTGDVGYLDAEGRLFVLGRMRSMIKRGGAVVAPRELEEAAGSVAGVRVAAATSTMSPDALTETIHVVVESDREPGPLAAEVSRAIAETTGFAPARVVVTPPRTIPITANGKIQHGRLRALLDDRLEALADGESRAYAG